MLEFLIGGNSNLTPRDGDIPEISKIDKHIKYPDLMQRPAITDSNPTTVKTYNFVELQNDRQLQKEFDEDYYQKSIMSLDGIFSPVSLYPTPWNGTYHMSKYTRSKCPYCKGKNIFDVEIRDQQSSEEDTEDPRKGTSIYRKSPCPFCIDDKEKEKSYFSSVTTSEVAPPYIVASGTDLEILDDRAFLYSGYYNNPINQYTLNPIVLMTGEYSCFQSRSIGDLCAHSITSVGFGLTPPTGEESIDSIEGLNTPFRNFSEIDTSYQEGTWQGNHRFFGLRAPLVIHGWGHDLEGFPVPNSSGEYQLTETGEIKLKPDGTPIYKNQVRQSDGTYSAPYKEKTFYKGWAQLPTTWPVGPLDLRWDENAKVWTVGSNYRPVWITIEHDLVNENPVRGVIEDGLTDSTPLPDGFRKLVFVRDSSFLFKAPRGAALYCKYDSDSGFYQPIYNRPLITTGTIVNGLQADIDKTYTIKSSKAMAEYEAKKATVSNLEVPVIEKYRAEYSNPLEFTFFAGKKGIFSYVNGTWTLTSIN